MDFEPISSDGKLFFFCFEKCFFFFPIEKHTFFHWKNMHFLVRNFGHTNDHILIIILYYYLLFFFFFVKYGYIGKFSL
ncbi:hypothetical protein KUTeg_021766, partial [Tegillarca granosa]